MEKNLIGWQKQPNKLNIQGTIEKAIERITGEEIELFASGRTDSRRTCPSGKWQTLKPILIFPSKNLL